MSTLESGMIELLLLKTNAFKDAALIEIVSTNYYVVLFCCSELMLELKNLFVSATCRAITKFISCWRTNKGSLVHLGCPKFCRVWLSIKNRSLKDLRKYVQTFFIKLILQFENLETQL